MDLTAYLDNQKLKNILDSLNANINDSDASVYDFNTKVSTSKYKLEEEASSSNKVSQGLRLKLLPHAKPLSFSAASLSLRAATILLSSCALLSACSLGLSVESLWVGSLMVLNRLGKRP